MRFSRVAGFTIVLLAFLTLSASPVIALHEDYHPPDERTETYEGVVVPVPESLESYAEELRQNHSEYSYFPQDAEAFIFHRNGHDYLLFATDVEPEIGTVVFEGYRPIIAGGAKVIYGYDVNIEQNPTDVTRAELDDNPEKYRGEYVRTVAKISDYPYAYDAVDGNFRQPTSYGSLGSPGYGHVNSIGEYGEMKGSQTAQIYANDSRNDIIHAIFDAVGEGPPTEQFHTRFGVHNSTAVVEGVYLQSPIQIAGVTLHTLHVASVDVESESVEYDTLYNNIEEYEGEVVTVQTHLQGSKIDVKDVLTQASACDGSETVGAAPNCVPAAIDAQLHAGVTVDASGESPKPLLYGGIANYDQQSAVEPVSGTYQITAKVTTADRIHPSASGYALQIYDMEKTGSNAIPSAARSTAIEHSAEIRQRVEDRLVASQDEHEPTEYESLAVGPDHPENNQDEGAMRDNSEQEEQDIDSSVFSVDVLAPYFLLFAVVGLWSLAMVAIAQWSGLASGISRRL